MRHLDSELRPVITEELEKLYIELINLQYWLADKQKRIAILFEGRDTAGKGGAVFAFSQYLNPRGMRIVALTKPTDIEQGQWYFQRYIKELPNPGQICFFDRSWYNRALVEPVMGFCTTDEYQLFMKQVNLFEEMLVDDGVILFKFWFSINADEQGRRLEDRKINPLKKWKLSTVDRMAQEKWEEYTAFKRMMFQHTHTEKSPWVIINGNDKGLARTEAMKYVLSNIEYDQKGSQNISLVPDPKIVRIFGRDPVEMNTNSPENEPLDPPKE